MQEITNIYYKNYFSDELTEYGLKLVHRIQESKLNIDSIINKYTKIYYEKIDDPEWDRATTRMDSLFGILGKAKK